MGEVSADVKTHYDRCHWLTSSKVYWKHAHARN